ncbi:DNA topoisomerase (ATP-hydrolyzing) subunit A [uncultured Pseudokineococcus sp.]|uniref:DNA gyrase/topoisomerase IV subunit A n=1 Tax=uncultured Pseudokineococcus sp. TaxID=1642928 RepID=UPI002627E9C1|nr:DNA topoisomerase (ATP-hydrolyzing) [uncultured Pseudokineococcus sp.]
MARRTSAPAGPPPGEGRVVDIDVAAEMEGSFLEYAYSVIYARALPDARDGLKPVQRRILYAMADMGLRPERAHVKCSRVVGEVMGKLHPHGDTAIYDAMVRMAQPFSLRLPLVDGHGNFGSLDDGPAAARYTEARMAASASLMVADLDEDVVDLVPNYDGSLQQPGVLPSALPNLLVNGASGIAVGMATNMPPHNLVEVVAAARHLIERPDATLEDLLRFVPGPDLPSGGRIIGLDGVREAYASGRGTFRTRATTRVEQITPRRKGIVVTELPYGVGPERVVEKIADAVKSRRLQGVSDVQDLTDRESGLRLVVEVKSGFDPDAVLEQLYRLTPMEDSFGVNNVCLVEGQPRTLGLRELLSVYVEHRLDVVRRRSRYRLRRASERLHLVEGLLVAVADIDEVIAVIRSSDDAAAARERLMTVFELSQAQAEHILELQLRRLTRFSTLELESRRDELRATIAELEAILGDEQRLRGVVSDELAEVAREHGTPRRTVLLEASGATATAARGARARGPAAPLEVPDFTCWLLLSATGLLARTSSAADGDAPAPPPVPAGLPGADRAAHDVVVSAVRTSARGEVGAVTSRGRVLRLPVVDVPALPPVHGAPSLAGGAPLVDFTTGLERGERVVGLARLDVPEGGGGLALATAGGVVKRVAPGEAPAREEFPVVGLRDGDEVVGALDLPDDDRDLVLVTSDAQLLRFPVTAVRPQGRAAGGMAGVRLAAGARVVALGAVAAGDEADARVVTVAGSSNALPGTENGTAKVAPFTEYPAKGRGTGGVRCHRFLRGEDALVLAFVGAGPVVAGASSGAAVPLPEEVGRRDGSGAPLGQPVVGLGGRVG